MRPARDARRRGGCTRSATTSGPRRPTRPRDAEPRRDGRAWCHVRPAAAGAAPRGRRRTELPAALRPRREPRSRGPPRPAGGAGLLPGRLEPGLQRPDGAVPARSSPMFERLDAQVVGISVDGVVVPPGLRPEPRHRASRCSPTSSRRAACRAAYGAYRERRGRQRAGAVRARRGRRRSTGATCRRSASTRAPTASSHALEDLHGKDRRRMSTVWESTLTMPVSPSATTCGAASDAPLTLVEYGDYECPFCGAAHPVIEEVLGRARRRAAVRLPPLPARDAPPARALRPRPPRRPGSQGRFWEMHDLLFADQRRARARRPRRATPACCSLDVERFVGDLREPQRTPRRCSADFLSGVRSGVNGTPTFFVNGAATTGRPT